MSARVIDASVAVKWFVPEVHSIAAGRWLGQVGLLAPDLIVAEVGNVVWKKLARREITVDEGRMILRGFGAVPLETRPMWELLPVAFEIAVGLNRTLYDSVYLALAIAQQTALVTADRKLYDAIAASVLADHVRWVEDLP